MGIIRCTPWRSSCFSVSMTLFRPQGGPRRDSPICSQVTHGVSCRPVKLWTAASLWNVSPELNGMSFSSRFCVGGLYIWFGNEFAFWAKEENRIKEERRRKRQSEKPGSLDPPKWKRSLQKKETTNDLKAHYDLTLR